MVVGDPQNRRKQNFVTQITLKYYYNTNFGDPVVGRDPPVEKH